MSVNIAAYKLNEHIDVLIRTLDKGQCIGLPTETVYGLAADATNGEAVAGIFEMKDRPRFNPLICHVDGLAMARKHGKFNPIAETLANTFWPGPLTLVLPIQPASNIHDLVTANLSSVGLRCPKGIAGQIIAAFGRPLAAPSANKSGKLSPSRAEHVADTFKETDLLIVDDGPCEVGLESTIVKIADDVITILRQGSITAEMIEACTKVIPAFPESSKIEAPCMIKSHNAPNAEIILESKAPPHDVAYLGFGSYGSQLPNKNVLNLSATGSLREAAANLYDYLQKLDKTAVSAIHVAPVPHTGLGLAINDRLNRAAAPRNS
ncbi:MAG: L-threonylcarbamoyladenylate synthase [Pseudomonadota bacterium]